MNRMDMTLLGVNTAIRDARTHVLASDKAALNSTGVAAVLLKLTPDEARYVEELLDASDGELAPAVLRALAYADTISDERNAE